MAMGIWLGAVGVTLLLGWRTTAGPVLIAFTVNHGVHLSDLAVAVNAATGAALLTHRLASSPPCQRASTSGCVAERTELTCVGAREPVRAVV